MNLIEKYWIPLSFLVSMFEFFPIDHGVDFHCSQFTYDFGCKAHGVC